MHHELAIAPAPAVTSTYEDYFGNLVTIVAVQGAHTHLVIRARSTVDGHGRRSCRIQATRRRGNGRRSRARCRSRRSSSSSTRRSSRSQCIVEAYARASFPAGRPLLEAVLDLTGAHPRRLHVRSQGDDRCDAADRGLQLTPRCLSGLRAAGDCLPAVARHSGAVHQRLHGNRSAAGHSRGSSAPTRRTPG